MIDAETALKYFKALRETLDGVEVSGKSNLSKVLGCMELLDKLIGEINEAQKKAAGTETKKEG